MTQETIAPVFKFSRLATDVLKKAIKICLEHRKQRKQAPHGKMSVKDLVGQDIDASNIKTTDNNTKPFEKMAKEYNVDFAMKKDKTAAPPKHMVFFRSEGADVITQTSREFVKVNERKYNHISVKERLTEFREQLGKDENREWTREHQKGEGQLS